MITPLNFVAHALTWVVLSLFLCASADAAVWQYAASTADGKDHAVMWIPPRCARIRGILIGRQVILESTVFEDPIIRRAAADESLAVVLDDGSLGYFRYGQTGDSAESRLAQLLRSFADQSGYGEIVDAPLLSIGHSGGAIFAWNIGYWNPRHTIALIGLHTVPLSSPDFDPKATVAGVPSLVISGEYESWGNPAIPLAHHWKWARGLALSLRATPGEGLITELVERGAGHFSWTPDLANYVAMFIRKASNARIPPPGPIGTPVQCNTVPADSGWLTDANLAYPRRYAAAPYRSYRGDPLLAFWTFDEQMARETERFNQQTDGKKRQMLGFVQDGDELKPEWLVPLKFEAVADGQSVKVDAKYQAEVPSGVGDAGERLFASGAPIKYRLIGGWRGGGEQTGPNTFRIKFNHFGLNRAGSLMVMAYSEGDATHAYTEIAGAFSFPPLNTLGTPQSITFPSIADQPVGAAPISLDASSSSGLPVEYLIRYGPATIVGRTLAITDIPAKAKMPIKVSVLAYQWGRTGEAPIASAVPVEQTFLVRR